MAPKITIPGYTPPAASDVMIRLLQTLAQQNQMQLTLLECILRAQLGDTKERIQEDVGIKLMSHEEAVYRAQQEASQSEQQHAPNESSSPERSRGGRTAAPH